MFYCSVNLLVAFVSLHISSYPINHVTVSKLFQF